MITKNDIKKAKFDLTAKYNGVKIIDYDLFEHRLINESALMFVAFVMFIGVGFLMCMGIYGII